MQLRVFTVVHSNHDLSSMSPSKRYYLNQFCFSQIPWTTVATRTLLQYMEHCCTLTNQPEFLDLHVDHCLNWCKHSIILSDNCNLLFLSYSFFHGELKLPVLNFVFSPVERQNWFKNNNNEWCSALATAVHTQLLFPLVTVLFHV